MSHIRASTSTGSRASAYSCKHSSLGETSSAASSTIIVVRFKCAWKRLSARSKKKTDKETLDLLMHSVQEDLHRHAEDIKTVEAGLSDKMGVETMWKVVGLMLTLGAAVGGLVSFLIGLVMEK